MFLLAYISVSSLLHALHALTLELKKMRVPHAVFVIIMNCGYVVVIKFIVYMQPLAMTDTPPEAQFIIHEWPS
jgi:hypothetical protein